MILDYKYIILGGICAFSIADIIMKKFNIEGRYYMNHFINNGIVMYNTFNLMINSYSDIHLHDIHSLYLTKSIVYSIHLYHMLWYSNVLRYDDWLHHILMIGVALPLTEFVPQSNLIGHCLFFVTGLPGFIDYFLLFLTRNRLLSKDSEKYVNTWLNLWIRCPGCIMNVTLNIHTLIAHYNNLSTSELIAGSIIIGTVYWNGVYFMAQIVSDYANNQYRNKHQMMSHN